jgi:hypothetical protein
MYLAKAFYRKNDFEACKSTLLGLLARYPQHIPLKYNLALCLYEQAEKIFQSDNRKAFQTREAIYCIKHSLKLFTWVQKQFRAQFKFIRTLDLQLQQTERIQVEQFKDMLRVCESKVSVIMDMLQYSEAQLQTDEQNEQRKTQLESQRF